MKRRHLTTAFVHLFATGFINAKREAALPKEVRLSNSDRARLSQKPDNWRSTIYWLDQSSPVKFFK